MIIHIASLCTNTPPKFNNRTWKWWIGRWSPGFPGGPYSQIPAVNLPGFFRLVPKFGIRISGYPDPQWIHHIAWGRGIFQVQLVMVMSGSIQLPVVQVVSQVHRGCTHQKDFLLKVGWVYHQYKVFRPGTWHMSKSWKRKKLGDLLRLAGIWVTVLTLKFGKFFKPNLENEIMCSKTQLLSHYCRWRKLAQLIKLRWPQRICIYLKHYRCPVFQAFWTHPPRLQECSVYHGQLWSVWKAQLNDLKGFTQWIVLYTPTVDGNPKQPPGMYKTL